MTSFIELITSFPVVIFTGLLAFSLAWWVVSMLAGGLDADAGLDADVDSDGMPDSVGDLIGAPGVPASVSLSLLSAAGWVVTMALVAIADSLDVGEHAGELTVAFGLVLLIAGTILARFVSRHVGFWIRPLFATELAPSVTAAVGELARTRGDVNSSSGEALILTGPLRSTVLPVRASGRLERNVVVIVDSHADGVFTVVKAPIDDPRLAEI